MLEEYINYKEMMETLSDCIKIASVKGEAEDNAPYGIEIDNALRLILEKARRMGFKAEKVADRVVYVEHGTGDEMIGVLGHLDVVPAGDGWNTPPFEMTIKDNKLYGRGTMDDKGPMVAALYGLKAIKDAGIPLTRRIRLIFGGDEESGSSDIAAYKETEEIPSASFTPDADFPVINSEKGIAAVKITSRAKKEVNYENTVKSKRARLVRGYAGEVPNKVPDYAKLVFTREGKETIIESKGKSAHGSTPERGVNAIDDAIRKVYEGVLYDQIDEQTKKFIDFYMMNLYGDTRGKNLGIAYSDKELGDLTINVGMLRVSEGDISLIIDFRHPAAIDGECQLKEMEARCNENDLEYSLLKHKQGLFFPEKNKLVSLLMDVYNEETGQKKRPIAIGGGTYAKSLPNTVAFGPIFPNHEDTIHQANEYISIDDLKKCTSIYIRAMITLANME